MTAATDLPPPVSETARERETFTFDDLGISTAALFGTHPPASNKLIPTSVLSSTPDPALTAFAQLGLYRLNATHSIVSLFDRTYQHFVAEAIRCAPLCENGQPTTKPEGQLVFCGTAIPRAESICEHVLTGPPAEDASIPGKATKLPVSVIPNLDLDPRFCYVRDENKRFYAGVPIRSPTGINIGVYCVLDNKPRPEGLTEDQIQFARDISKTVMDYLQAKRSNEWYRREERMVRGLGSFVEGQATLSNWSDNPNNPSFRDIPGVREGALNKKLQATPDPVRDDDDEIQSQTSETRRDDCSSIPLPAAASSTFSSKNSTPRSERLDRTSTAASSVGSADHLHDDIERVFSKASNIIRESIEVEGVVFLDASVRTFGGLVGKELFEPPILERIHSSESSSDESQTPTTVPTATHTTTGSRDQQPPCNILGFSTSSGSSINGHRPIHDVVAMPERILHKLLRRYPHGRIFDFEPEGAGGSDGSDIDESSPISPLFMDPFLPSPFGSGDATANIKANKDNNMNPTRSQSHQKMASCLQKMFSGARSLAFVPLFDGQKNRWFAGGFVWTKNPTRIFTVENELSYLRVFGLASMAEVGRLSTKAADKTKTDILGSISHELRSPLHGVVGAVDLLRNTVLDGTQENILRTIETSGRTLLDTIDHLLDYSKVNNIVRSSGNHADRGGSSLYARPGKNRENSVATLRTPTLRVQLDRLTEEVIESVLAGWSYRNTLDAQFSAWHSPMQVKSAYERQPGKLISETSRTRSYDESVRIYLDIYPHANWSFRTHPGAFRRIMLNLFGNSLKFTRSGFIRITLRQEESDSDDRRRRAKLCAASADQEPTKVILTVSDTGKGISQDYLRHHLFTPFSQEDQFAPGTGLGLSLVRQMVVTLGGNIDVVSQVGQGTTITVVLPLVRAINDNDPESDDETIFRKQVNELAGCHVHLRGFDGKVKARLFPFGQEDGKEKSQLALMESICHRWLKMHVVHTSSGEVVKVEPEDFVVVCLKDDNGPYDGDGQESGGFVGSRCPHLFICRDSATMYALAKKRRPSTVSRRGSLGSEEDGVVGEVSYVAQPIGPRKLAEALLASRLLWNKLRLTARFHDDLSPGSSASSSDNLYLEDDDWIPSTVSPFAGGSDKIITTQLPILPESDGGLGHDGDGPGLVTSVKVAESDSKADGELEEHPSSILIVDDNAINLKILAAYMMKLGHAHVSAMNGREAVDLYTKSPGEFECIVTDISMPVMDGLESTRRIREFERTKKLKPVTIIALTGLSGAEIQQDAFGSGVDLFLTRPLVFKGLVQALESTGHGHGGSGGAGGHGNEEVGDASRRKSCGIQNGDDDDRQLEKDRL
ncbi:hsp90-like protein [Apodospora peruviana]|uniref:histidine kinase n=1 Tax=Apodospora peruviana TaxID=516989 RepID=A0AAE0I246_9PEZI|nr:hsp90-like protein [Apodospora peruviana]